MARQQPVVIVGAGVTGLSLALMLQESGIPTVVIEKEDRAGGLARSFEYDGHIFDIGPHRFHTERPDVDGFLRRVLQEDKRLIDRVSQVRFEGHFYPWPLHPSLYVFLRFPPMMALSAARDLFFMFSKKPAVSFRDQIVNMYGGTLYRNFFQGYSSKFLGIVPEMTHPDWAKTGVDRAIIDSRVKMDSLWQLLLGMMIPRGKPDTKFLYPAGGCEQFARNLVTMIEAAGGKVHCGRAVDAVKTEGNRVVSLRVGRRTFKPSTVVWTGTIHSLAHVLGLPRPDLRYLALICYNILLTDGERFPFQWCYHGTPDVSFSRVSIPENFDAANTPPGRRSMCVEVTCAEGDRIWEDPMSIADRLINDMKRESLLKADREIIAIHPERFPWAYPIYQLDYRDRITEFERQISQYENVLCAGRLGRFWYNNMDHCVEASLELAPQIREALGSA